MEILSKYTIQQRVKALSRHDITASKMVSKLNNIRKKTTVRTLFTACCISIVCSLCGCSSNNSKTVQLQDIPAGVVLQKESYHVYVYQLLVKTETGLQRVEVSEDLYNYIFINDTIVPPR